MGPGAVAPGHGARPGEMPRSSGRTRPCGTASPSSSGARRLTAPPAASRPPATGLRKKSGTQRRTRSQRGKSATPSGGQPGHKGTTLARTESPDHVVDHDPSACSGCGAPLSDADRHRAPRLSTGLRCARATPPGGHRTPRPSLPLRRLRHRDRSRLPGRRDRPGPVRATHHRLGELPAVRPVRSREALGRTHERPLRSVHLHSHDHRHGPANRQALRALPRPCRRRDPHSGPGQAPRRNRPADRRPYPLAPRGYAPHS